MAMTSLSWILLLGAANGAVVAVLLWQSREHRVANRLLAALLAVAALRLVPYIIGYAGAYDAYPWLSFAPFYLPLAIGPLLWLHVVALTTGALPPRWRWHLVPAALHLAAYGTIFVALPLEAKHALVRRVIDPIVAPAITLAALTGLAVYGVAALRQRARYQAWLDDQLSNREEFRLAWLGLLLGIMAVLGLVWLGFAVTDAFVRPLSYFDEFPFYVVQAGVVWAIGLGAWRESARVYPVPAAATPDAEPPPPTETDRSTEHDWPTLGARYLRDIESNGWFRDPHLYATTLARHLATNTTYLSKALNRGLGQGFNEVINRLRVQAVSAELSAGSTRDLVQLGFDAGFNSKASFQRAFVLYTGQTPSAYRAAAAQTTASAR
ncbi:MAG: helix-turn-helix domain-containing protein [Gemmatimonadaceae bacterium]|nr:helix-turn-helix domain-containing protein [Gemmatimonadaceae bacterium]